MDKRDRYKDTYYLPPTECTVAELIAILKTCPQKAIVRMVADPEGNGLRSFQSYGVEPDTGEVILFPSDPILWDDEDDD